MNNIKLAIILYTSINDKVVNYPMGASKSTKEISELTEDGYLQYLPEKNGVIQSYSLTDKGTNLVESLNICANMFDRTHELHNDTVEVLDTIKENASDMVNKLRDNTSNLFHKMAETIKTKS